jgi:uncharacterized membrane protein YedE/YeeE
MENGNKYINPYLGGFLLGLVIILSVYFTREGLGASGAFKRTAALVEHTVAPKHTESDRSSFHKYFSGESGPLKNRLVFMVVGVFIGGFISGAINKRLKLKLEHSPNITPRKRIYFALAGGALFGIGSSFANGCTSGAALSPMAVLATSGFVATAAIFGSGYIFAFFFKKIW